MKKKLAFVFFFSKGYYSILCCKSYNFNNELIMIMIINPICQRIMNCSPKTVLVGIQFLENNLLPATRN